MRCFGQHSAHQCPNAQKPWLGGQTPLSTKNFDTAGQLRSFDAQQPRSRSPSVGPTADRRVCDKFDADNVFQEKLFSEGFWQVHQRSLHGWSFLGNCWTDSSHAANRHAQQFGCWCQCYKTSEGTGFAAGSDHRPWCSTSLKNFWSSQTSGRAFGAPMWNKFQGTGRQTPFRAWPKAPSIQDASWWTAFSDKHWSPTGLVRECVAQVFSRDLPVVHTAWYTLLFRKSCAFLYVGHFFPEGIGWADTACNACSLFPPLHVQCAPEGTHQAAVQPFYIYWVCSWLHWWPWTPSLGPSA